MEKRLEGYIKKIEHVISILLQIRLVRMTKIGIDAIQGNWRTNVKRLRGTYECILRREGVLFMWIDLKGVRSKSENIPKNIIDGESTNHCSEFCLFFCFRR